MDDSFLKDYAYKCFIGKRGYTLEKAATNFPLNYPKIMMFYYNYIKEQRRNLMDDTARLLQQEYRVTLNELGMLTLLETRNFIDEFSYLSSLDTIYDGSKSAAEIAEFEKATHGNRLRAYAKSIELSKQVINSVQKLRDILYNAGTRQYAHWISKCNRQIYLEMKFISSTAKAYNAEYKIKY